MLFYFLNNKLKTAQESDGFSATIKKLRALIVAASKNMETISFEHATMFNRLKTTIGFENGAKAFIIPRQIGGWEDVD